MTDQGAAAMHYAEQQFWRYGNRRPPNIAVQEDFLAGAAWASEQEAERLRQIVEMAREGLAMPPVAERWLERIEALALEGVGERT